MDPLSNPFRPGAGTSPPLLTGRDNLIAEVGITLQRALGLHPSKSLMPIGLRGVGKTVLLNRIAEDAKNLGFEVCMFEATERGDLKPVLSGKLRQNLFALDRTANLKHKATQAVTKALGVLKSFSMTTPDGHVISLDLDAIKGLGDSGNLTDDLSDLLIAVGEAARDIESALLIAIDEIQYLEEAEFAGLITAIHRTSQLDLPVVLVGTGLPSVPGKAGRAKSYSERLFNFPVVGSLSDVDASAAIGKPAEDRGVVFERAALDEIIRVTKGYPYFLQEWAYHSWNLAERSPITLADIEKVSPKVQDALDDNFFLVRLDRLTGMEKRYLKAMAELPPAETYRSADIAAQYGAKMASVSPTRSGLIQKGMIYSPEYGQTQFTVPLFDDFLRRHLTKQ
jgi:hypothetical protein